MRVFRKLLPFEWPHLRDHLLRLSREDRMSRFTGYVADEVVAAHCARLDWRRTAVIGFFEAGVLRGAAELAWDDPRLGWRAELAVTVERPWQDQGTGTELARRAIVICRNRALRSIYMICLLDNRRMQHIARKFEGSLAFIDGQAEADIVVPYPSQATLFEEVVADGTALFATWWDRLRAGLSRGVLISV